MKYYPINLNVKNRDCLVVGGGHVGTRKVQTLLKCGAQVTVVSPHIASSLMDLRQTNQIAVHEKAYDTGDIKNRFLVIAATNDPDLGRRILADAETHGVLCNIADIPEASHFILPSIVEQGDLMLTVSTSGKSPALSKYLRRQLSGMFGPEYATLLIIMGNIRRRLLAEKHAPEVHKEIFTRLIHSQLPDLIKKDDQQGIADVLKDVLGNDFNQTDLTTTEE